MYILRREIAHYLPTHTNKSLMKVINYFPLHYGSIVSVYFLDIKVTMYETNFNVVEYFYVKSIASIEYFGID